MIFSDYKDNRRNFDDFRGLCFIIRVGYYGFGLIIVLVLWFREGGEERRKEEINFFINY